MRSVKHQKRPRLPLVGTSRRLEAASPRRRQKTVSIQAIEEASARAVVRETPASVLVILESCPQKPAPALLTREARAIIDGVWGVDAVVFIYTF